MSRKEIHVFFGGSFDPPHMGHHLMLQSLLSDDFVDCVHLVPTKQNPLKGAEALGNTSFRKRCIDMWLEWLQAEVPAKFLPKLKVEWAEFEDNSVAASYTVDTLRALKASWGGEWVLAGGSDLLADLGRWKTPHELLNLLHSFWLFEREGYERGSALEKLDADLKKRCEFRLMNARLPAISSKEIRDAVRSGPNALQKLAALPLLPPLRPLLEKHCQSL